MIVGGLDLMVFETYKEFNKKKVFDEEGNKWENPDLLKKQEKDKC